MKTDETGGQSAESNVEERLSRRYAMELERAERDYPVLLRSSRERVGADGAIPGSGRSLRAWRRMAAPMTAIVVLVAVSLVGVGLALRPSAGPAGPSNPAVVRGSDGIPTSIDGQRVYRIGEKADWQNLTESFLLAGYATAFTPSCPAPAPTAAPQPSAEANLLGWCSAIVLATEPITDFNGVSTGSLFKVAPRGSEALTGFLTQPHWLNGPAIVMRVHTHDPEAAQCGADQKAACEAAVVVEAVVWPAVPTEINGERVYRATDQVSFPSSGSFLLGGPATKPSVMPPCPAPVDQTNAEQQLIPYCYFLSIDGLGMAPMSTLDEPNGEVVVARVHTHDALAVQCPPENRPSCADSIVVESVIWRSTEAVATATPSSVASSTTPSNPASGEGSGPVSSASIGTGPSAGTASASAGSASSVGPLDSGGVPTSIAGTPVHRAAALPSGAATFLLGGALTHDTGCAPTTAAVPPGCGYWMVDGVKVGTMIALPELPIGSLIVARVAAATSLAICPDGKSCPPTRGTLVVTEIVWSGPIVEVPPPPVSPVPSAS
jgi:hypothetical protein